ncbi:unnamed protein product [Cuscuta europaea]|uniref:Glycosyltransferase n=1 Tax=Cuscuta europaea TaxID=41803 RepID=A0A9P1E1T7_CUSEU|nr:unnamed protein product [Cuscuta europaea]
MTVNVAIHSKSCTYKKHRFMSNHTYFCCGFPFILRISLPMAHTMPLESPPPENTIDQNPNSKVIVVTVPFLAQGHLNQLLHLSRLIASHGLQVYYIGFSVDISVARRRLQGWDPLAYPSLHFQEFPSPPSYISGANPATELESFSDIMASVIESCDNLRHLIAEFLDGLSRKCERLVVVHDSLMATAVQDAASIPHAEAYTFHAASAFTNATVVWEIGSKVLRIPPFLSKLTGKLLLPSMAVMPDSLPSLESCFYPEFLKFMSVQRSANTKFCSGNIYDACRPVEGPYLEMLAKFYRLTGKGKLWAIGPLNPVITQEQSEVSEPKSCLRHRSIEWLDKQPPKSVVFVSFGTLTSLSGEQILELAKGLEQSQQKFIWVVRDVLKGETPLPEGYEDEIQGKGLILRDWAPQMEILNHPSTGGFLTHCGWNSCMESIVRGVPMATWPIHFDQPRNAVLMTEVLGIGIMVKEWGRRDEVIRSDVIADALERLMVRPEGAEMRRRAVELGKALKQSVKDGGLSRVEMADFIHHMTNPMAPMGAYGRFPFSFLKNIWYFWFGNNQKKNF